MNATSPIDPTTTAAQHAEAQGILSNQHGQQPTEPFVPHRGDRFALTLGVVFFLLLATLVLVDIITALLFR